MFGTSRLSRSLLLSIGSTCLMAAPAGAAPSRADIIGTMKRATRFMVEKVSTHGGYVWAYLPDMSRRWGELEATPGMIWVQPPGTPTMGNLFLDAYHATGDEYYYQAAMKAADALIAGEVSTGGWNYFINFDGPVSTQHFYDTVGRNAWRLEEFQHNWGNATYDDNGTAEAMKFILRLYAEKFDPKYKNEVMRNIDFVLESQYPNGGWPQRFPLKHEFVHHGLADYTSYITFNDDVTAENVDYLIQCTKVIQDQRLKSAIWRGMNIYLLTQQGPAQPGWALQYTPDDLKPAAARSYEPKALATHATAAAIEHLLKFYEMTGDSRFIARVPEALDWLDSVRLPDDRIKDNKAYPTFIEIGTGKPLYLHREGSNVVNGHYYADYNPANVVEHYSSTREIDVAALRREYEKLKATPAKELTKNSPLMSGSVGRLPEFVLTKLGYTSDRNTREETETAEELVSSLNTEGWWPTRLLVTSHPYTHDGSATVSPGDYRSTRVGDETDTSPYIDPHPVTGISIGAYIEHMATLIAAVRDRD